ncbi:hypothetical protein MPC4_340033 [Methylocella tundrae]|uniref:Uncharacterized protein n=1 Tax=Methylocella tundrae TaxID=227605 RepID=A0A8B6M8B4_METTU|nr:hypothetical protein MPC1_7810002 [Methylocella tundrae]VTZ51277.1 hypothetical protein MPC4_340033 [Methylocella tundrae]
MDSWGFLRVTWGLSYGMFHRCTNISQSAQESKNKKEITTLDLTLSACVYRRCIAARFGDGGTRWSHLLSSPARLPAFRERLTKKAGARVNGHPAFVVAQQPGGSAARL